MCRQRHDFQLRMHQSGGQAPGLNLLGAHSAPQTPNPLGVGPRMGRQKRGKGREKMAGREGNEHLTAVIGVN